MQMRSILVTALVALGAAACSADVVVLSGDGAETERVAVATEAPTDLATPVATVPDVLDVICTADGGTQFPNGTAVSAQSDGVHLRVDNRSGESASINGFAIDVAAGKHDVVTGEPPGRINAACWPGSRHEGPAPEKTTVHVADPDRYWVSDQLECPPGSMTSSMHGDFAEGAPGEPGDPLDLARRSGRRSLDNAEFVRAGYPDSPHGATVVARQDGKTVAVFRFQKASGGWLLGGEDACA